MGKIEDIIFQNYKRALSDGNLDQARKALELATNLKDKVDNHAFIDYDSLKVPTSMVLGQFFNPLPYKYFREKGIVELSTSVIHLTTGENRLFSLFADNQSRGKQICIVTKRQIALHMWGKPQTSSSAIRIAIHRLRCKIEMDPKNPQVLISLSGSGYAFLGNEVQVL